jgi:hypothetical protein
LRLVFDCASDLVEGGDLPNVRQMAACDLTTPIINYPYDSPERHFELGQDGLTGGDLRGG